MHGPKGLVLHFTLAPVHSLCSPANTPFAVALEKAVREPGYKSASRGEDRGCDRAQGFILSPCQLIPTTTAFGHRPLGLTYSDCFSLETAGGSELSCSPVSGFSVCDTMLAPFSTHVLRNSWPVPAQGDAGVQ